jgi:hypothetical protein
MKLRTTEESKQLQEFLNIANKKFEDEEPIYAECSTKNGDCNCTGECKRVIGFKPRNKHPHGIIEILSMQ